MKPSLFGAVALIAGCTPGVRGVEPLPCPSGGVAVTRSADGVIPPRPRGFFTPPLPPPASVRGARALIRVLVDTTGAVVSDSITVCGVADASYAAKMAYHVSLIPFEPAHQAGQRIRSQVLISYQF